ncbi:MAG TPA: glycosyltransferase [Gemmataceae bacterium]|nr:glycosyltransferase [Gemmataceae bacterium]
MPFLSCILLSHNKADHVGEAIDSLLAQTFPDWEAVIFDSGVLYDQGFFSTLPAMKDPRFRLIRSWETEELRKSKTIASWCFNECFRQKLLNGQYVVYLCDDDLYYPNAFQTFYDHTQTYPEARAMYASVDMTAVTPTGEKLTYHELLAQEMKGSCCCGGPLDCYVDYLQLCHKADLFDLFPDEDFWPEDRAVIAHADGVFLEKIGSRVPIFPIPAKIGENRKVPDSLNCGGERLEFLISGYRRDCIIRQQEEHIRRLEPLLRAKDQEAEILRNRLQQLIDQMDEEARLLRYRLADKLNGALQRMRPLHWAAKKLILSSLQLWKRTARRSA